MEEPHDDTSAPEQQALAGSGDTDSDTRIVSKQSDDGLPIQTPEETRLSTASSSRPKTISQHYDEAFIEPFPDDSTVALQEDATHEVEGDIVHEREPVEEEEDELTIASRSPLPDETMDLGGRSSVSGESFEEGDESTITLRSRSSSSGTFSSGDGSAQVDWDELEKEEVEAPRNEGSDESTAFLLARLEQENNALATNPKATLTRVRSTRKGTKTRPPSMQQLKRLVNEPTRPSLRYSLVPEPPAMTELEFWAALVNNYPQTAQRLPTLTSNKIRGGVPPPLRGVVWMSIAGSRDSLLESEYERLCGESSPYENLIGKDIGRSFPGVEMFRDPLGDGQQMLARVLKSFSLYDNKIGYCQGLGFVVGPLLMHMGEREAFCVLVRLMEHYDLRSCFLPDLSGLHLLIYQFQHLLSKHHPELSAHLDSIQVEPLYVSQWFLSFFAVTCPLPMLLRIYDVILTEGASETLMRVALSLMRRNEKKIMGCAELEDVMGLLLSRALWDTYNEDADDLVNDFVGLTGLVTREGLESLEASFAERNEGDAAVKESVTPSIQAAASKFLGRFWAGSGSTSTNAAPSAKVTSPTSSLNVARDSRPSSFLRRTPSKQSMASTLNSTESESHLTISTDATALSRNASVDATPSKHGNAGVSDQARDLHNQIEDLLTALSNMQREQNLLASELQKEREEREEDRMCVHRFLEQARKPPSNLDAIPEGEAQHASSPSKSDVFPNISHDLLSDIEDHFTSTTSKRSSLMQQTRHQMREDIKLWKDQCDIETTRSADLTRQLADEKTENTRIVDQFRTMRTRLQEAESDKQRLEKNISDFRTRRYSTESDFESVPATPIDSTSTPTSAGGGLRELKLGRSGSIRSPAPLTTTLPAPQQQQQTFAKRGSSLGMQAILATENHKPPSEEALLVELVAVKTSEAVARQELEEVKAKLDSLRKMLGQGPSLASLSSATSGGSVNTTTLPSSSSSVGGVGGIGVGGHRPSASEACLVKTPNPSGFSLGLGRALAPTQEVGGKPKPEPATATATVTSSHGGLGGGFFSGWGKRTASQPAVTVSAAGN